MFNHIQPHRVRIFIPRSDTKKELPGKQLRATYQLSSKLPAERDHEDFTAEQQNQVGLFYSITN